MAVLSDPSPDQLLALAYAGQGRGALSAVLALDRELARVALGMREEGLAGIRLAWWRERLEAIVAGSEAPAEPLLQQMTSLLDTSRLEAGAAAAEGWALILDPKPSNEDLLTHAASRSALVFGDKLNGVRWALVDLSRRTANPALAALAMKLASQQPRNRCNLASQRVLAALAERDVAAYPSNFEREGHPFRIFTALRAALFG